MIRHWPCITQKPIIRILSSLILKLLWIMIMNMIQRPTNRRTKVEMWCARFRMDRICYGEMLCIFTWTWAIMMNSTLRTINQQFHFVLLLSVSDFTNKWKNPNYLTKLIYSKISDFEFCNAASEGTWIQKHLKWKF